MKAAFFVEFAMGDQARPDFLVVGGVVEHKRMPGQVVCPWTIWRSTSQSLSSSSLILWVGE